MPNVCFLSILKLSETILSFSEQNADDITIFLKFWFPLNLSSIILTSSFFKSFIELGSSRFNSIKAYVFIDGLTDVTKTLKQLKKNEIDTVLHNWNSYVKSDGHSDYENSFQELIDENKKLNSKTKSLIVIGDGRNNYRNISEEVINNLNNQFEKIYWMNPEKKKYWNTGDSQIKKFEIISETTSEVRNYNQLRNFVNNIDFKKTLKWKK